MRNPDAFFITPLVAALILTLAGAVLGLELHE